MDRRSFLSLAAVAAGAQTLPPSATTRDWSGQVPIQYPDPDIIALDNRFRKYIIGNTSMKRLYIGTSWAEGPAWNGAGNFLVWSDIPGNVQLRWIQDNARVTTFRTPPATATAIPSITRAGSYPANMAAGASFAMRLTGPSP